MDTRSILKDQIEELRRRLDRIKEAIASPTPAVGLDKRLLGRIRLRFLKRILDQEKALNYASEAAEDANCGESECWDRFCSVQKACQPLFEESLAVLEGVLARNAGLDDGICDVADRLIAEIGQLAETDWKRFTVLSEGELYTNVADIIRLRFPSAGIWDLPVAAHECGHFASKRISEDDPDGEIRHPFQEFLAANNAVSGSREWHHLNELFADAFATYAIGPAYAFTALLCRFDASRPYDDDDLHPSPATRAYLILQTLKWMDGKSSSALLYGVIADLEKVWAMPDEQTCATLDGYLDSWLDPMLEKNLPLARYKTDSLPYDLAAKLLQRAQPELSVSLRDLLNAAWIARIQKPDRKKDIEETATEWSMGTSATSPIRLVAHG